MPNGGGRISAGRFCRATILTGALVSFVSMLVAGCVPDGGSSFALKQPASPSVQPGQTSDNIRVVSTLPPPKGSANAVQFLAVNDMIEIDVFRVDELDRIVEVNTDGTISLPLIGSVKAAGLTSTQLERAITRRYKARYLQDPQVSVLVKTSSARRATVDGEIAKAGLYEITAQSSLSSVLSDAGGLRRVADPGKIYVFRDIGSERQVANFSLKDIRRGKAPDPRIYPGDVIVVFASSSQVALRNLREALGIARSVTGVAPLL